MILHASPHPTERWPRSAAAGGFALALALGAAPGWAEARRCGTERNLPPLPFAELAQGDRTNCSASLTHPDPRYFEGGLYEFVMVVHVLESEDGDGALSDEAVLDQVRGVNEDFRSLLGQAEGRADTQISFRLASIDPEGNPTKGITRTVDDAWFHDRGAYWKRLAWDPTRYVNVYTNDAAGLLGYAFLPADGGSKPGEVSDRVVIHWQRFGRGRGEADNAGRTLTHELGHYLGLDHTFAPNPTVPETFVCAPGEPPDCYTTGDLLCDTPSEDSANEACEPRSTCGGADPVENFMNYTPDRCMDRFSPEQALRMRCTALAYRSEALWPSGRLLASELPRDGDLAHFSVSLRNESSFPQDFSVSVLASDFDVALAGDARAEGLGLGAQETLELPLVVDLSRAQAKGSVRLAAQSDLNLVPTELELEVVAVPKPELLLSTASDTVEVSALEETKVTVELENLGVVEERVEVELGGRWITRSDLEGPLTLAAFERHEFDVWVRADDDTLPGETAPLRLSATSTRAPARVEPRTVTLVATRWLDAEFAVEPAPIEARPGSSGRVTFSLSNLGNAKESFRLGLTTDVGVSAWPERWDVGPLLAFDGSGPFAVEVAYRIDERAPLDRELGLRLSATPNDAAEELAAAEATFVVSEAGRVRVEADRTLAASALGEPQPFTVEVRNWSKQDDEFRVRVRGESRVLSEKTQVLPLRAGKSTELEVVLSPRRARFVREATQVTVTSLSHPERTRSIELVLVPRVGADAGSDPACEDCANGGGCSLRAPARRGPLAAAAWLAVAGWLVARRRRALAALRG